VGSREGERVRELGEIKERKGMGEFVGGSIVPAPPLLDPRDDEVMWMSPEILPHRVLWRETMIEDPKSSEFRTLMAKALRNLLPQKQQQQIFDELEKDPKLVFHSGLTPQKFPDLVENNPLLAIEFLQRMVSSPQVDEYYDALVSMRMSLHSMEVVNRVTLSQELPSEYIHRYITNWLVSLPKYLKKKEKERRSKRAPTA